MNAALVVGLLLVVTLRSRLRTLKSEDTTPQASVATTD
jgi:hypothetical protein